MFEKIRMSSCLLCICLLVSFTACSQEELSQVGEDSFGSGAITVEVETTEEQEPAIEEDAGGDDIILTEYRECFETYLDVLSDNRLSLTNALLSDAQKRSGMDIGDGKIAIMNVCGDATPELLYIYNEPEIMSNLAIYTYNEDEGVANIFDYSIHSTAGGEGYYCVYLTRDGELMTYYARSDAMSYYGFWSIFSAQAFKNEEYDYEIIFGYENSEEAQLYYTDLNSVGKEEYSQYGEVIPKEQFDEIADELIGNIDSVLFQGAFYDGTLWFYEYDLWKDITPFEEDCMSYEDAVAWLERQIAEV